MLNEREVITLAFGNYSSLVAAQWANGTSHYDAHHNTLYSECRTTDVLGGGGGGGGTGRTRVPRLLLLDAPYASAFDEVEAWARKYTHEDEDGDDASSTGHHTDANADGFVVRQSPSSVLWGGGGGGSSSASGGVGGGRAGAPSSRDRETTRLSSVADIVRRHVLGQHGLDEDDEEDEAEDEEEGERECDQVRADGDEEEKAHGDGSHDRKRQQDRQARLKRRLFDERNITVPWWQYVTTGLGPNSVTSLKPLQHLDAAGDLPALHSFGYGLAHYKDSGRASAVTNFNDGVRRALEAADQLQGVQCFIDGDGLFGGAAANALEVLLDEAGAKTPLVQTCAFARLPAAFTDPAQRGHVAFSERRLDEVALNQLLATLHLSRPSSAVYIPVPLSQWDGFFRGAPTAASPTEAPQWLHDDRATAQLLAAVMDTALYGLRDSSRSGGGAPSSSAARGAAGRSGANSNGGGGDDPASVPPAGPLCYMHEWCRVVRPAPSLRVAAAMGALPQPVSASAELWGFLSANPLLPDAPPASADPRMPHPAAAEASTPPTRARYFALTHAMASFSPMQPSGQVLGHAVSLRGAGRLPATVYRPQEAMLRYGLPLLTSTYLPLCTDITYPLSSTFPMELLFTDPTSAAQALGAAAGTRDTDGAPDAAAAAAAAAALRQVLQSVDVGTHVLSTYASAPMLRDVNTAAQAALRFKMDRYCDAYAMERDDWREAVEEGLALYDTYNHEAPMDAEESDGDDYY